MSQDNNLWNRPAWEDAGRDTSPRPTIDCAQCPQCGTYVATGSRCDCTPDSAILQLIEIGPAPAPADVHSAFYGATATRPKEISMAKRKPRRKPRY